MHSNGSLQNLRQSVRPHDYLKKEVSVIRYKDLEKMSQIVQWCFFFFLLFMHAMLF